MKLSKTLPVLALAFAISTPIALLARADNETKLPTGPTADEATTAKLVYGLLSDSRYAYGRARSTTRCRRTSSSVSSKRWTREAVLHRAGHREVPALCDRAG
jgi:hypothetical protein